MIEIPRQPKSRHIAIVNFMREARRQVSEKEIVFAVEACRIQLEQHLPPLWPSLPRWTCGYYANPEYIRVADVWTIALIDSDGDPSTAALHYNIGGLIGGSVDMLDHPEWEASLAHECLETAANPYVSEWRRMPDGREVMQEICDPVQNSFYPIEVDWGSERRHVWLSNFVSESYFDPAGVGPYDFRGDIDRPFQLGDGYWVVRKDGERDLEYGAQVSKPRGDRKGASRSFRGLAGTEIPRLQVP